MNHPKTISRLYEFRRTQEAQAATATRFWLNDVHLPAATPLAISHTEDVMRFGWKTITGGAVAILGYLAQPDVLTILPHKVASVVTAVGAFLGVIGVRHAIAKIGNGG